MAAAAWSAGDPAKAGRLSQKGRWHWVEVAKLNSVAHTRIFSELNKNYLDTRQIDLHQLHVGEALATLDAAMRELAAVACRAPLLVDVICGRGTHSARGQARIAPEVKRWLQECLVLLQSHILDYWDSIAKVL